MIILYHNYLFRYIINKDDNTKLENLAQTLFGKSTTCDFYIRHKTVMLSPTVLKKNGIRFARVCFSKI